MAVQRIAIANNKKITSVKLQKKEIANILAESKDEKARIKVEHIIRDDFVIEAYEMIELMCDLLHERIRQITNSEKCPEDLKETVSSLIWAANQCEISELQEVKKHLSRKFGPEFTKDAVENNGGVVNARLFNKLSYKPPSRILVTRYLEEIAEVYKIDWAAPVMRNTEGELILEGEGEGEGTVDPNAPFGGPSGYSVPMAPGTGLVGAYGTAADSAGSRTLQGGAPSTMDAAELEEYRQFQQHQQQQQSSAAVPIYAAVPGPPPPPPAAAPAPVVTATVVSAPTGTGASGDQNLHEQVGAVRASSSGVEDAVQSKILSSASPQQQSSSSSSSSSSSMNVKLSGDDTERARNNSDDNDGNGGGYAIEKNSDNDNNNNGGAGILDIPPAPTATGISTPAPTAPAPAASEDDPLAAMQARLAALQKRN